MTIKEKATLVANLEALHNKPEATRIGNYVLENLDIFQAYPDLRLEVEADLDRNLARTHWVSE